MKLRKMAAALAMSALMVCTLGAMAGCSNSEQVIREGTVEFLDHYKNVDEVAVGEVDDALPASQAEMLGIESEELAQAMLEGFDYTLDDVKVDGDNAEAVVTVTCKNLSNLTTEINDLQSEVRSDSSLVAGMGTDELFQWLGDKLMEYINNAPIETHEPITLDFRLNGNTWEMTQSSQAALSSLIAG